MLTYDDVPDDDHVGELVGGKVRESKFEGANKRIETFIQDIRLLFDCVGGQATKDTVRLASKGAQLVVYGGMSKEDVQVPPFLLIFKDIHIRGFWRSGWFNSSTFEERSKLLDDLVRLVVDSKVPSYPHTVLFFDRADHF